MATSSTRRWRTNTPGHRTITRGTSESEVRQQRKPRSRPETVQEKEFANPDKGGIDVGRQTPTRQAPFLLSLLSVFATAALYAALFLSINYFVLRGDTAELRDQVHLAYESGDLQRERYLPFDTRMEIGRAHV